MSELEPSVSSRTGISPLWIIPIVALVAGIWMVVQNYLSQGPTISVEFKTAESLVAGKTKVKMLDVDVGQVESVTLKPDLSGVKAVIELEKSVTPLLREDTKFWVVRARIGAGGISGVGTLLGGAYIEMAPGEGKTGAREYTGLEVPPLTPVGAPGIRLLLTSNQASIRAGDAILHQGFKVGRVESMEYDIAAGTAHYQIFIDAPYDQLITTSTRFWDVSGFNVDASASGVQIEVGAIETLLTGGIAFGSPPGMPEGRPVDTDHKFTLFKSYADILKRPYVFGMQYVVSFAQQMGGLNPGAKVTFRGIQIGQVEKLLLEEFAATSMDGSGAPIPVLIYLEPGRLAIPDTASSIDLFKQTITTGVGNGLRASLKTGNLLTGQQYIDFDFHPNAAPAEITTLAEYTVLPTMPSGIGQLTEQISSLLAKLNDLPLDTTIANANSTLARTEELIISLNSGMQSLDKILASNSTQDLPAEMVSTMQELRSVLDGFSQDAELYQDANASLNSLDATLDNLNRLLRKLSDKPNALIFAPKPQADPIPEARP